MAYQGPLSDYFVVNEKELLAHSRLLSEDDQVYKDLAATSKSLRNVAEKIEKGEGAIGRLVADEALYDDVKGVVGEARAAIDDFRETSPIVTFTRKQ